mmetsp:Transcript_9863/g.21326  ORF Transcript_9863/g.21326 Transcript_9863/m.21326 type:complete len:482 (+) Transcript_9863:191-1636(+)
MVNILDKDDASWDEDQNDVAQTQSKGKWTKGVAQSHTDDRVNIWSLNGFGQPVFTGGMWDRDEARTLEKTIKDYCASKNVTLSELCGGDDHRIFNKSVRGAWKEIAQCVPHRTVLSVYRRALRQCHGMTRGSWSEEEVASLFRLVGVHGHRWKIIQDKLNRSAIDCRVKFFESNDQFDRGKWSTENVELLLKKVRSALNLPRKDMDVREINQWTLEHDTKIPWTAISGKVKRRRADCYFKWKQMTKRSNKKAIELSLEPIPMARETLKINTKAEYYQWKAEQDPKWRQKYAEEFIMPLLHDEMDGSEELEANIQLLDSIIKSRAARPSEVSWHAFVQRGEGPREIWDDLVDKYAKDEDMDLPVWKLAKVVKAAVEKNTPPNKKALQLRKKKAPPLDPEFEESLKNLGDGVKRKRRRKNHNSGPNIPHEYIPELEKMIKDIVNNAKKEDLTVERLWRVLEKKSPLDLSRHKDMVEIMLKEAI